MRSLRAQLLSTLLPGVLLLLVGALAGLYGYVETALEHGLDASLTTRADAIIAAVHLDRDGHPYLRDSDIAAPQSQNWSEGAYYYQIWRADGSTLARFSPGSAPLSRKVGHHWPFADTILGDGTPARVTAVAFQARTDDIVGTQVAPATRPTEKLWLAVAHDRRGEDRPLGVLLVGVSTLTLILTGAIAGVVAWGVNRGLRPLAKFSDLADQIDASDLEAVRFPADSAIPAELRPIAGKLNDLLDRLGAAFARERRFSAAVAHELRTPLSELRSACDVAQRWPDDPAMMLDAVADAGNVAIRMAGIVETLLNLTRSREFPPNAGTAEPVNLAEAVAYAWEKAASIATTRQLTSEIKIDADLELNVDAGLFEIVLDNLVGNAVTYATEGGRVVFSLIKLGAGNVRLEIGNAVSGLTEEDLPHMFEPFWRKDQIRSSGPHVGLGLALVQAYCTAMRASVRTSLASRDWFTVTLTFPCSAMKN